MRQHGKIHLWLRLNLNLNLNEHIFEFYIRKRLVVRRKYSIWINFRPVEGTKVITKAKQIMDSK